MDALQAIKNRHSVRSYKKGPVAREKVEELVAAANSAPFAGAFHITAVLDSSILEGLEETTLTAMRESPLQFLRDLAETPGYRPLYEAPSMLVFSAPRDNPFGLANCANAATTGAIAGTAMDLGTCFVVTPTLALNRDEELCKKLGIPKGNTVHCCLLFGHTHDPDFGRKQRDLGDNVNYFG